MKRRFAESELIINSDGSVFHLHLKPEQLADKVILVGDPGRVETVAKYFDNIECEVSNREFRTITGTYQGKRISVQSTGIGCDNIDIVVNELDALANIGFTTREEKDEHRQLSIVRIGTCGGLQTFTPVGTFICSEISIGFDGLLNFYNGRDEVCDLPMEEAFKKHMNWNQRLGAPYFIHNDEELLDRIFHPDKGMVKGVTIACGGFYGPQGRVVRQKLAMPNMIDDIEAFRFGEWKITNFEMEGSAIAGIAAHLGHEAITVCCAIAHRYLKDANTDYKAKVAELVQVVMDKLAQ